MLSDRLHDVLRHGRLERRRGTEMNMRVRTIVCVLPALVAATACCGPRGAQSGSVYVTALSTTDWQRYKDQFQPRFELSECDSTDRVGSRDAPAAAP